MIDFFYRFGENKEDYEQSNKVPSTDCRSYKILKPKKREITKFKIEALSYMEDSLRNTFDNFPKNEFYRNTAKRPELTFNYEDHRIVSDDLKNFEDLNFFKELNPEFIEILVDGIRLPENNLDIGLKMFKKQWHNTRTEKETRGKILKEEEEIKHKSKMIEPVLEIYLNQIITRKEDLSDMKIIEECSENHKRLLEGMENHFIPKNRKDYQESMFFNSCYTPYR